jgi:hypothetical protein
MIEYRINVEYGEGKIKFSHNVNIIYGYTIKSRENIFNDLRDDVVDEISREMNYDSKATIKAEAKIINLLNNKIWKPGTHFKSFVSFDPTFEISLKEENPRLQIMKGIYTMSGGAICFSRG